MKVGVTGSHGLIGTRLVKALADRGDEVTALSREPTADELAGLDAVVHLAGAPVAQRWNAKSKQEIAQSRERGTRAVVDSIAALDARPKVLVSASGVGYYGPRGDEPIPESSPPGDDFLAQVCITWERDAAAAGEHGVRTVQVRTGVVLDKSGGALAKMLTPFKLGVGGPVAGGKQYMPWIHLDDVVGIYLRAVDDDSWSGAYNAAAPEPVTNKVFSKALGKALHRPAFSPVPKLALKILYGEMAEIVTTGQRAVPERTLAGGYVFTQPDLDQALRRALA